MDPSRNLALENSKLQIILQQGAPRQGSSETPGSEPETVMPPPPAYHSVVQPTNTIRLPSMHNPYDPFDEEEDKSDDVPEVNINATTQVRGHGNIISIAQMDSMRIANLLSILVHGGIPSQEDIQPQPQPQPQQSQQQGQGRQVQMDRRLLSKINININCGATVIGDRNIVGPGLGDIARHMQIAQQRQQQQQQQQQQTQQQTQTPRQACGFQVPLQAPIPTPPMSRSSSFGSDGAGGVKRKTEEERDVPAKRVRG